MCGAYHQWKMGRVAPWVPVRFRMRPLRRKAEKKKQRHLVSDMLAGCFCVRFDIEGGKTCL
uniref:Uncharacterized protein n=1 Tax=Podoviridae sp. ctUYJ6 TaxID=2827737 RepID=A0A8S5SBP1_9CAUD|nr:MAG TPA: hypothetical protein [Podoviridae sp. ctUYJ6]DAT26911.1 MAG TPA: hypothetical protein [Caudoviricetes sp.]